MLNRKFLLYVPSTSSGISVPYPSISLHAILRITIPGDADAVQGLYMQIATPISTEEEQADDEETYITLTIVPPPPVERTAESNPTGQEDEFELEQDEQEEETPTQALYGAVSACSNLHPDPPLPGEEEDYDDEEQQGIPGITQNGGLPPPVEGSSGWITAENMHEYFDEEGNWIADGEAPSLFSSLGPGAGNVRAREDDGDIPDGADGEGNDEEGNEETKWRRTD